MFSFFGGSGSNSGKPASQSTTPVRETSAAMNPPTYDPSQMQQQQQPQPSETASSFSFISGSSGNDGGLFGGMSVAEEPQTTVGESLSSGFSFLNSSASEIPIDSTPEPSSGPSGFSFMVGGGSSFGDATEADVPPPVAGPPPAMELDLLSMPDVVPQQDVKLSKVAATKVVKKKKKVARVGAGREDDEVGGVPGRRGSLEPDDEGGDEPAAVTHQSPSEEAERSHYTTEHVAPQPELQTPSPSTYYSSTVPVAQTPTPPVARVPTPEPLVEHHAPVENNQVQPKLSSSVSSNDILLSMGTLSMTDNGIFDVPLTTYHHQPPAAAPHPVVTESVPVVVEEVTVAVEEENDEDAVIPKHLLLDVQKIDDTIRDSMVKIRGAYQTAYASQHYLLRQIEDCHNQIISSKEKLAYLETKQANFAKQEEFEQAEQMTFEIENVEKDLQGKIALKAKLIEKLKKHRFEYDQEKSKLITTFHQSFNGLTKICEKTVQEVSIATKKVDEYAAEEKGRIEVEQQRIDLEKTHCDREQQTLNSESSVIEEAIKSQVGDYYVKKETVEVQLFAVQDEIRKLEELLAQKRQEEAELSKNLKQVESKIGEVRKKYDRQLMRIQERKDTLSRAQRECEIEQEQVDKSKDHLETTLSEAKTVVDEAMEMVRWKQTESQASDWIVQDLLVDRGNLEVTVMTSLSLEFSWYGTVSDSILGDITQQDGSTTDDQVNVLRQEVESKEMQLAQVKSNVDELHIEHELLETRQKKILETIERCEIAKKLHAANKRFKEAANSAKELKEATDAKEKLEQDMAHSQSTINEAVLHLETVERELIQSKEMLQESQREEKLRHLNVISQRVGVCNFMVKRLTRTLDQLLTNSGGHSRVGLITVAVDLYRDEIDQLRKLQVALSIACNIANLDEYTKQFEIAEPEEVEEVVTSEEIIPEAPLLEEQPMELVDPILEDNALPSSGFSFMDSVDITPVEIEPTADEVTDETEQVVTIAEEEIIAPQVSAEELLRQIAELEELVDQAAGEEDFDKAATIQEQVDVLRAQLEAL